MSRLIRIPASMEEAVTQLGEIGAIVTAREWERAAILAAYVMPDAGHGGRSETAGSSRLVSATEFARHGIHGLRSKDTILRYVNAWLNVRSRPAQGRSVNLAGLPDWPPDIDAPGRNISSDTRREAIAAQARADGTGASKALDIASNPRAMAAAIKADPETAAAAQEALMNRDLEGAGFRPLQPRQSVPDPEPRWQRLTLGIAADIRLVLTDIGDLRNSGQHNTAERALRELRDVLIEGVSRCETIPDTIEGIHR